MLLDSLMSEFGATWIEHRVLDGRPADVYELASRERTRSLAGDGLKGNVGGEM